MSVSSQDAEPAEPISTDSAAKEETSGIKGKAPLIYGNNILRYGSTIRKPGLQYDNFFTPENKDFYAEISYLELDPSRREIRLLRVHPQQLTRQAAGKRNPHWQKEDIPQAEHEQPKEDMLKPERARPKKIVSRAQSDEPKSATIPNERKERPTQQKGGPSIFRDPLRLIGLDRRNMSDSDLSSTSSEWSSSSYIRRQVPQPPRQPPKGPSKPKYWTCELLDKIPLARIHGRYFTISYCAGRPTDARKILVNGLMFNAFANLEHAIECTLKDWIKKSPEEELLLWVDQICIDQSNPAERASQVGLMRDIYQHGEQVYVCLSTAPKSPSPTPKSPGPIHRSPGPIHRSLSPTTRVPVRTPMRRSAGGLLPRLNAESRLRWIKEYGTAASRDTAGKRSPKEDMISHNELKARMKNHLWKNLDDGVKMRNLFLALNCIFASPWWSRAWVYQEFIMAPRACFLYNDESLSWAELAPVLTFFCEDIYGCFEEIALAIGIQRRAETEKLRQDRAKREQEKKEKAEKKKQEKREQKEKENEESAQKPNKLLSSVDSKRKPEKEDVDKPRRWYRFLSFSFRRRVDAGRGRFRPSELTSSDSSSLDFTQRRQMRPNAELQALNSKSEQLSKFRAQLKPLESARNTVASVTSSKIARWSPTNLGTVLKHSRNCQASDSRDRIYAFLGLAHQGYDIVPSYSPDNTIVHAHIDTARSIILYEDSLDILEHASAGRIELGAFLPSWVPDWMSKETSDPLAFQKHILGSYQEMDCREPFRASDGSKASASFREDGSDASNVGLKVRGGCIDLLNDITKDHGSWVQFQTSLGLIIDAPKMAQRGDQLWVLYGARYPFILRKEHGDDYSLLGVALIWEDGKMSQIMFGNTFDGVHFDEQKTREIFIV
jgi:hypothetical protein